MLEYKLEKFEGPLGLLLKLIESEKLDITQINLARVADQYIDYIKLKDNINPEEVADFLVVAAKLLLIKSKALLPYLAPEEVEEIEEFERELKMYQEFLSATKEIQELIGQKRFMYMRPFNRKIVLVKENLFSPPKELKAEQLAGFFDELIVRIRPFEQVLKEEKLEHKINIEDQILAIEKFLLERATMIFSDLLSKNSSKTETIVSFLAMLELARMRQVEINQAEMFGQIEISKIVEQIRKM
ncbi:MAG: segregation/condensation protein A [bacterium]